ncbi:MAG: hypothetical protein MK041_03380 [Aquabacterium sp.]|nr:hypothetical protein [Aquabacterium sp.]
MINPATLSLGTSVLGMLTSGVGAFFGAQSQRDSLSFQAQMADINARLAESTAQSVLYAGQRETQRVRLNTAQLKSRQRVALAASGVALNEGSAAEMLTTTDAMGEVDANTVEANAVRAAWGHRTQAVNYTNDARMARSAAGAVSPFGSMASTLIGGASQVAAGWYGLSKAGAWDKPATGTAAPAGTGIKPRAGLWDFGNLGG